MNKRQDIIAALKARLVLIRTANGYLTNVGTSVFVWRSDAINTGELPALNVRYAAEPDQINSESMSGPRTLWTRALPVGITAIVKGATGIDDVESIVTDVWKAIGVDETFGGKCMGVIGDSDTIIEDQEERKIAGAVIKFTIQYRTNEYES